VKARSSRQNIDDWIYREYGSIKDDIYVSFPTCTTPEARQTPAATDVGIPWWRVNEPPLAGVSAGRILPGAASLGRSSPGGA
jgi:hypothetical protein